MLEELRKRVGERNANTKKDLAKQSSTINLPKENKNIEAQSNDTKTIERLFQLFDQQQSQLSLLPALETKENYEDLRKKLNDVSTAMEHLDGEALAVIRGKAQALRSAIEQASDQNQAEQERDYIEADDCLCDYYYVLRSQILNTWLACQVIHSEMVDNDKKTKLDLLAENIDKVAGCFPGLSMLTGFIKGAASGWSYRDKKAAMQNMAGFCLGVVEGDQLIDALARQLTIAQEKTLKATLTNKTGRFRKVLEKFKKAKNWALVNEIDNPTKEFAAKQASQLLEKVMKGMVSTPCRKKDLPQLFAIIMGVNSTYQASVKITARTHIANSQIVMPTISVSQVGYDPSLFAKTTSTAHAADSKATAAIEEARTAQKLVEELKEQIKSVKTKLQAVDTMENLFFEMDGSGEQKQINMTALDRIDLGLSRLQARAEVENRAVLEEVASLKETVMNLKDELDTVKAKQKNKKKKQSASSFWKYSGVSAQQNKLLQAASTKVVSSLLQRTLN